MIAPGDTLWIINEVTGSRAYAQEASEGAGTAAGDPNLLTEGSSGSQSDSVALYNVDTGEIDGHSIQADPGHGFSYQYDAATDTYVCLPAFIPCFA